MKEGSRIKSVGNQEEALGCGSMIDLCPGNVQDSWLGTGARAGLPPQLIIHQQLSSLPNLEHASSEVCASFLTTVFL